MTIETPDQQRQRDQQNKQGDGWQVQPPPVTIINVTDPREMLRVMSGRDGKDVIMNVISENPGEFRRIMGQG